MQQITSNFDCPIVYYTNLDDYSRIGVTFFWLLYIQNVITPNND